MSSISLGPHILPNSFLSFHLMLATLGSGFSPVSPQNIIPYFIKRSTITFWISWCPEWQWWSWISRLRYLWRMEIPVIIPQMLGNCGTWFRPGLFRHHQGIINVPRALVIVLWFRVFVESTLPEDTMLCILALKRRIRNNSCWITSQWKRLSTLTLKGWIPTRPTCLPFRFISGDLEIIISIFWPWTHILILWWWCPMESIMIRIISQLHHTTMVSSWHIVLPLKSPSVFHTWVTCTVARVTSAPAVAHVFCELLLPHLMIAMMIQWYNVIMVMTSESFIMLIIITIIYLGVLIMFLIPPLPSWSMAPLVSERGALLLWVIIIPTRRLIVSVFPPSPSWSMMPLVPARWALQVQIFIMLTRCMTVSTPPPWSRTPFVSVTGSLHVCVAQYINHMWPYPNRPNHNIDNISISIIMKSKNWWQMYH